MMFTVYRSQRTFCWARAQAGAVGVCALVAALRLRMAKRSGGGDLNGDLTNGWDTHSPKNHQLGAKKVINWWSTMGWSTGLEFLRQGHKEQRLFDCAGRSCVAEYAVEHVTTLAPCTPTDEEFLDADTSPGDFTPGPTGARATSASISAHASTFCWRKRLWSHRKKCQIRWCLTMIHAHDGWCDLVRCPEGLVYDDVWCTY